MKSKTPVTDNHCMMATEKIVPVHISRRLERERNRARKALRELIHRLGSSDWSDVWEDIKRFEKALR